MDQEIERSPVGTLAIAFAEAVVSGEFEAAQAMLSEQLQSLMSSHSLREDYESMTNYCDEPACNIELMEAMIDWPAKEPNDLGWAYVSIDNGGCCEAVSATVMLENGKAVIRAIEWGRP